ncbi:hypothetical protein NXS98_05720 [Fontisphaera persica]|uniref:hypothetical protein n=1 Tax=Fontisphaera persica TaxID=2974023 RepID=UPI0024C0DE7F|nr:hypothetical protein [Fontisphaera persica]WCJ60627.1 hypothetical protein NXS98_05720 [Fontisphaera persica]
MVARFDLYDFLANLIPGLVFLWCVQMLAGLFGWTLPLDFTGGLAETSILIAIGYVTGLLLQGLSQGLVERRILKSRWRGFPSERWLLPDDDHFSADYKQRLLEQIHERFKVATDPGLPPDCPPDCERELRLKKNRELFYLVYHAVGETSPRPLTFNAHYGLFRVLLTMFSLLALLSLAGLGWSWCCRPAHHLSFALWAVVFVAATWIAYFRCKKRGEDFAQSVYDLFMAGATDKPPADKST